MLILFNLCIFDAIGLNKVSYNLFFLLFCVFKLAPLIVVLLIQFVLYEISCILLFCIFTHLRLSLIHFKEAYIMMNHKEQSYLKILSCSQFANKNIIQMQNEVKRSWCEVGYTLAAIFILECFHEEVIFMGRTFRFKYRYMNDMYIYFHETGLMLFHFSRIWVHLVSQHTNQSQNKLQILRRCRLSPGSGKRQLWPFFILPW